MSWRRIASIVGALLLIAMFTSLAGGIWLETMLSAPDYLVRIAANESQVVAGVLLELANCAAVVGIGVLMFPVFKRYHEGLALAYAGFRIVEAAILAVAAIIPLVVVTLSQLYGAASAPDAASFEALGTSWMAARTQLTGLVVPVFFSLGALLFYSLLYRSKLVPRFISVWGLIAVAAVFTVNLLAAFGLTTSAQIVFVLPIILNEIFLGIWLIVRGFDSSAMA
jgi:hypothetical protein